MPAMYRPDFYDKRPGTHLIVAAYDADDVLVETDPTRLQLLMGLARALGVEGDFTGIDKAADAMVLLAFAEQTDVERFAHAVLAKRIADEPDWASQYAFRYDRAAYRRIRVTLGYP